MSDVAQGHETDVCFSYCVAGIEALNVFITFVNFFELDSKHWVSNTT